MKTKHRIYLTELAKHFGVSNQTMSEWKQEYNKEVEFHLKHGNDYYLYKKLFNPKDIDSILDFYSYLFVKNPRQGLIYS